ncbi:hypothetical protein G6F45_014177 [Rhizopus arrhizus]|nr:hypothetical protein G6F45_014177 [Rhizopus arrhizus]
MWSPGTSSRIGRSSRRAGRRLCRCAPKYWSATSAASVPGLRRSTRAVLPTRAFRRAAARLERPSCTKRISVDSSTIAPITIVALRSSVSQDTAASTVSSRLNGLR